MYAYIGVFTDIPPHTETRLGDLPNETRSTYETGGAAAD